VGETDLTGLLVRDTLRDSRQLKSFSSEMPERSSCTYSWDDSVLSCLLFLRPPCGQERNCQSTEEDLQSQTLAKGGKCVSFYLFIFFNFIYPEGNSSLHFSHPGLSFLRGLLAQRPGTNFGCSLSLTRWLSTQHTASRERTTFTTVGNRFENGSSLQTEAFGRVSRSRNLRDSCA